MLGGVVASCLILLVVGITVVGISPTPPLPARAGTLAAIAGLVVAALWLRRRDRRNYERALAHEAAGRAVAEDRLVIARELHDAVSRSLGAITVRAAVAQRLATDPDGLRGALHEAEEASREATDGLRRMLAVLRVDRAGAAGADGVASLEPALAGAVARARRTACRSRSTVAADSGRLRSWRRPSGSWTRRWPIPSAMPAPRAPASRLWHWPRRRAPEAGPTRARVALRRERARLRVAVDDDGPAPGWEPRPGAGQGLRGLRERVGALGGTLTAGPVRRAPVGDAGGAGESARTGFVVEAVRHCRRRGPTGTWRLPRAGGRGAAMDERAASRLPSRPPGRLPSCLPNRP